MLASLFMQRSAYVYLSVDVCFSCYAFSYDLLTTSGDGGLVCVRANGLRQDACVRGAHHLGMGIYQ